MADPASSLTVHFDCRASGAELPAGDLIRYLTHELRQPLSTIESIAYYLKMITPIQDSRIHPQVDRIQQLVSQMNGILTSAMQLVAESSEPASLLNLNELVAATVAELEDELPPLHLNLTEEPALVRLNAEDALHLVRALITGAGQLSQQIPLTVRTGADPGLVLFEIDVNGWTCPADDLRRLFEPLNSKLPGASLALASARRITECYGGRITAESETGRGTTLRSALPAAG